MKRLQIYNATHLVEWEDTPEGMKEAKMFRFCHPDFKHKRIRSVLRLDPEKFPLRRILNRWTGEDAVNDGSYHDSKTIKFRLTLDVEFDPQGTSAVELERHLYQVVKDATNNGTLTGETPATVEHYAVSVRRVRGPRTCKRCGTELGSVGYCQDETCPYSKRHQHEEIHWG